MGFKRREESPATWREDFSESRLSWVPRPRLLPPQQRDQPAPQVYSVVKTLVDTRIPKANLIDFTHQFRLDVEPSAPQDITKIITHVYETLMSHIIVGHRTWLWLNPPELVPAHPVRETYHIRDPASGRTSSPVKIIEVLRYDIADDKSAGMTEYRVTLNIFLHYCIAPAPAYIAISSNLTEARLIIPNEDRKRIWESRCESLECILQ